MKQPNLYSLENNISFWFNIAKDRPITIFEDNDNFIIMNEKEFSSLKDELIVNQKTIKNLMNAVLKLGGKL